MSQFSLGCLLIIGPSLCIPAPFLDNCVLHPGVEFTEVYWWKHNNSIQSWKHIEIGTQVWLPEVAFLNPFIPGEPLIFRSWGTLTKTNSLGANGKNAIRWWDNQPQLKEPPTTYGGTLGFHWTLVENGCCKGWLQTKCTKLISDHYSWRLQKSHN